MVQRAAASDFETIKLVYVSQYNPETGIPNNEYLGQQAVVDASDDFYVG